MDSHHRMTRITALLIVALVAVFAFSAVAPAATSTDQRQNERIAKLEANSATKTELSAVKKELNERVSQLVTRVNAIEAHDNGQDPKITALEAKVAELGKGSGGEEPPTEEPPAEEPPVEEPPVEPPPAQSLNCFPAPHLCGYPDATNTGVPAGTTLRKVGAITIRAGETVSDVEASDVTVTGANAKLVDSKVVATGGGGNGSDLVTLNQGATNFTIEDSEIGGNGSKTNAPESNVWNHWANAGFKVVRSYLHGTPDNIEGPVAELRDSYVIVDASYPQNHSENIYLGGGQTAVVKHSTLFNEHGETSVIFGDWAEGNTCVVEDSLIAGGGYTMGCNAKSGGRTGTEVIVRNHFARSPDGYFKCVGGYGMSYERGLNDNWSGNVYDDNGSPAPQFPSC